MPVNEALQAELEERLLRDAAGVPRGPHDALVREEAVRLRPYEDEEEPYVERVVEAVQQRFMDEFFDVTWPACPRHGRHPLWYSAGWWRCEQDGAAVAPLGELARVQRGG